MTALITLKKQVWDQKKKGDTDEQIAAQQGLSLPRVQQYVDESLQEAQDRYNTLGLSKLLILELARLEDMWGANSEGVAFGDQRALNMALKIVDRKLTIFGLDRPQVHIDARGRDLSKLVQQRPDIFEMASKLNQALEEVPEEDDEV